MWFMKRKARFVQSLGKQHPKTPDYAELELGEYALMFFCDDTMRANKGYERIKEHSAPVIRAFTVDNFDYSMGRYTKRGLPFVGNQKVGLKVRGEIHAVKTKYVPALDNHYDNGVQFVRLRVRTLIVDREHQVVSIGNEDFLKSLPEGVIRTIPELGVRHFLSNRHVGIVSCHMYIARRTHWRPAENHYIPAPIHYPKDNIIWLPKYYRYPAESTVR